MILAFGLADLFFCSLGLHHLVTGLCQNVLLVAALSLVALLEYIY